MKGYKKYKNSKFKWFEKIPDHWIESRISYLFDIGRGRVISELELNPDGRYPVYSSQTKNNGCMGFIDTFDFEDTILTWTTDGANAGTVFLRSGQFNCTNVCGTLKPKVQLDLKYYLYYLQNITPFYKRPDTNGAKIMNNEMASIYSCLPSIEEQSQIARYLDHQTSIIDQLIQKKEKLIELLKEKRQSIINEAVTKGLNPKAKMKDSGIEWLGEVPEHWEFKALKYLTINEKGIQTGPFGTQLNTKDYVETGIKVLNQKTLIDEDYLSGEEFISSNKFEELSAFEVLPGDIIMGTRGSFGTKNRTTFGKCSIVPKESSISVLHPCLIRIRLNEYAISKEYFKYYVNDSSFFLEEILNTSNSTTIEVIYGTTLKDIKFPVPPLKEQLEILNFLKKKSLELDNLIKLESIQIDKLKEYRHSIISEAVTGKIDVRDWQPNKK
jgi:type I restriction enzyme S subunit